VIVLWWAERLLENLGLFVQRYDIVCHITVKMVWSVTAINYQ